MSRNTGLPVKIRYEYEMSDKRPSGYAHGVWGGVNSHGEIEMRFYSESDKMPSFAERTIEPGGGIGPEVVAAEPDTKVIVRQVQAGVLVNYRTAKAVIEWLEEKVRLIEGENPGVALAADREGGPEQ
jgi:hypothetical protein